MSVQEYSVWIEIVRSIFSGLDRIVYGLIKWVLFGIFDLAHLTTNSDVFGGIYSRIYVILGIFMAFKLSFSFFQYIIDPESMVGKSDKSITKVFSRVFIMLATLIFLPTILFGNGKNPGLLARAQDAFLPSLPKIIFGVTDIDGLNTDNVSYDSSSSGDKFTKSIEKSSESIAVGTLKGFFQPSPEIDAVCGGGTYKKIPQIETLAQFANNVGVTCDSTINWGKLGTEFLEWINPFDGKNASIVDVWKALPGGTKYYKYSYNWGISTLVGILMLVLLIAITIDVAKRIFKLIVLEAIAPIPIMSLVDPKASKDGAFGKWAKSLTTTFLDIFIKLGIVYLIVVLIQMITNTKGGLFANFPENAGFRTTYLTVLLILGLILFAKEAPKFIKDALGMKDSGGGLFDDVKSIGKAAGLVGGAAIGAAGVVGSTVGSVRAQHQANKEEDAARAAAGKSKTFGNSLLHGARNVGAALSGTIGGTAAGVRGLTGKNAGVGSVIKNQQERNARDFERRRQGGTFLGGAGSRARELFTGESSYDAEERRWKKEEDAIKSRELALKRDQDAYSHAKNANELRSSVLNRAKDKVSKDNNKFTTGTSSYGVSGNYGKFMAALSAARSSSQLQHTAYRDSSGRVISAAAYGKLTDAQKAGYTAGQYFTFEGQEVDLSVADLVGGELLEDNARDYIRQSLDAGNANVVDASIDSNRALFREMTGAEMETTYDDIKSASGKEASRLSGENYRISTQSEDINKDRARINEERQSFTAQRKKANANRYNAKKGGS